MFGTNRDGNLPAGLPAGRQDFAPGTGQRRWYVSVDRDQMDRDMQ